MTTSFHVTRPTTLGGWHVHRRWRRLAILIWLSQLTRDFGSGSGVPTNDNRGDADPPLDITELFLAHGGAMYRSAVSIVRDHALAEDVVQESLVRAWRALPTFRGESAPRTWLLTITHNTAVSMLRRIRDAAVDPHDMVDSPVDTAGVEDLGIASSMLENIEAALFQLDALSRSIVVLREVEGLGYDEISQLLQIPLPTVKTRLFRARKHLSEVLKDWS